MVYGSSVSVGFERADIEVLAEKLRRMFDERRRATQVSLDGTVVTLSLIHI